jgi:hypothetical protein
VRFLNSSLHQIRVQVVRLERYCRRVKDKIWADNRDDLIQALADTAELGEISRRLYRQIHSFLQPPAAQRRAPLQDDPSA